MFIFSRGSASPSSGHSLNKENQQRCQNNLMLCKAVGSQHLTLEQLLQEWAQVWILHFSHHAFLLSVGGGCSPVYNVCLVCVAAVCHSVSVLSKGLCSVFFFLHHVEKEWGILYKNLQQNFPRHWVTDSNWPQLTLKCPEGQIITNINYQVNIHRLLPTFVEEIVCCWLFSENDHHSIHELLWVGPWERT